MEMTMKTMSLARRSFSFLVACVASATLFGCTQTTDTDQDADTDAEIVGQTELGAGATVSVGIHAKNHSVADIKARQSALGDIKFDHVLLFRNINDPDGVVDQLQPYLDAGKDVVLNIEFWGKNADMDNNGVLPAINDGQFDPEIKKYVDSLKKLDRHNGARKVSVRILHEMNGDWYPWCVNGKKNNSVSKYVAAYRRVSNKMPSFVKMELNFTANDQGGDVSWSDVYPGDDHVDIVMFTVYNLYGLNGHVKWQTFADRVEEPYKRALNTPFKDKPFGISEISSMPDPDNAGRKGDWFVAMAKDIRDNHPKIKQISYFLEDKMFGGDLRCWDWAYPTAGGDPSGQDCPYGSTRAKDDKKGMGRAVQILHGN
jgi:beta-mannanase